jgi:CRISPR/Cas system-associated exonuclease Cas4 (RecB family)
MASELREFVFCPRSWKLKRGGVAPPPAAKKVKQQKVEKGDRFHLDHGQAVVQARQQPESGAYWRVAGWAFTILGVFWGVFSY